MLQPSSRPARYRWIPWLTLGLFVLFLGVRQLRPAAFAGELSSDLHAFSGLDKGDANQPNLVVFVGASSLAYWDSLGSDMKPLHILNRAVGGLEYSDVIGGVNRDVFALKPAAVVAYAGDNDLAWPSRKTPESVAGDVLHYVQLVHSKLPDTWVYILSIKPSHARWDRWPQMKAADQLIRAELANQDHAQYIDVATPMFDSSGNLPNDLFISDGLHPSAKCYVLWTAAIKPVLLQRFGPGASTSAAGNTAQ